MLAHLRPLREQVRVPLRSDEYIAAAANKMMTITTHQINELVVDLDGGGSLRTLAHYIKYETSVQVIAPKFNGRSLIEPWDEKFEFLVLDESRYKRLNLSAEHSAGNCF